jgi:hypothetical protein
LVKCAILADMETQTYCVATGKRPKRKCRWNLPDEGHTGLNGAARKSAPLIPLSIL